MKKWLIIVLCFVVGISVFVLVSHNAISEQNYCEYVQELYFDTTSNVLEGKQTVSFFNYTDSILSEVCLHLYPNAFRQGARASVVSLANFDKAYPNGKSYGDILIESVECGETYLNYDICGEDENILKVNFGQEVYPDDTFVFEVGFSVSLANVNHRLGYGENTINLCNYYPILCVYENGEFVQDLYHSNGDPFYSKIANYTVEITYDKNLTLASTGAQQTTLDGDKKTTTIKAKKVRDFAMVLSSKFQQNYENYKGIDINYYYYNDKQADRTMSAICQVLDMNTKFGAYPYKTLSVVQANFVHGGMEYPNLVLISDECPDFDTHINVVVHELCHQWWYGVVGNNQYKYGFLDEGLTDYNTAMFYDTYPNYNLSSETIFNNATKSYVHFEKVYNDVVPNFSTSMLRSLNEFDTESEYAYLCYTKSMLMFASLKDMLGERRLNKCIKFYYEQNKFAEATPDDLVNCFSRASGQDLSSFFKAWFDGEVIMGEFK
ncbi:MAG: M1 family metallopeptidase [Clostridiales bacterium]|nr:M1 family metallopeptidase [Clostridiales bacterium]